MHIILDNGHGLKTPGKRSPDGTLIEAIYTRQLVKDLASELEKLGHVHILVPEPEDIPLNVRVKRINAPDGSRTAISHSRPDVPACIPPTQAVW